MGQPAQPAASGARLVPEPTAVAAGQPAFGPPASPPSRALGQASSQGASRPPVTGWVYAIGQLTPRFPDLGVEKEVAQAAGGAGNVGNDELRALLVQPENEYLIRQMCWVFTVGGIDVFMLACRDGAEAARLVDALPAADEAEHTLQVVVGASVTADPRDPCGSNSLPTVRVDQMLTFTIDEFIEALITAGGGAEDGKDNPREADEPGARRAAKDLFAQLTRRSHNWGVAAEDRARNYVALRYSHLYRLAADARRGGKTLVAIDVRPFAKPAGREVVSVQLLFRARRTDVAERYQCLVDVTDRFPFLAAPLTAVYD